MMVTFAIFAGMMAFNCTTETVYAKTYTITPKSKPCNNYSYNKENHEYVLIRSYMQKFEKEGGGTLILKKGTYKISNTIFVPSNVTIKFKDGVKLVKNSKSGTSDYEASSSMFQFIRDSKYQKTNVTKKYNGEKNIKLIGEGNVTLDMKNFNKGTTAAIAIMMANNKNVTIEGIHFKNIKLGHFIEMDGCNKVTIRNCKFTGMKDNSYHNKEAINLDTNDPVTGGFSQKWSKKDKTPNKNVTVDNCVFKDLVRAVGTHRYSEDKYHTNIKFTNNTVENVMTPLGILNWKNVTVTDNTFTDCKSNSRYDYTIFVGGVKGMKFTNNTFIKCKSLVLMKIYSSYQTSQAEYPATVTELSEQNIADLQQNIATDCSVSEIDVPSGEVIVLEPSLSVQ